MGMFQEDIIGMFQYDLRVEDLQEIETKLEKLAKRAGYAMARASNKTIPVVEETMVNEITKRYFTKKTAVRSTIRKTRASSKRPYVSVRSSDAHLGLEKFLITPTHPVRFTAKRKKRNPAFYRAAVMKSNAPKPLLAKNKPFVAVLDNGHKGMFMRRNKGEKGKKGGKLITLYGPAVPQMLKNKGIQETINRNSQAALVRNLEKEIEAELEKGAK